LNRVLAPSTVWFRNTTLKPPRAGASCRGGAAGWRDLGELGPWLLLINNLGALAMSPELPQEIPDFHKNFILIKYSISGDTPAATWGWAGLSRGMVEVAVGGG
jgi:hypothetical protein